MTGVVRRVVVGVGEGLGGMAGPLLHPFVVALAAEVEELHTLLTPPADVPEVLAIPPLFDPALTPYPQWYAQLAGLVVPPGTSTEDARTLVLTRGVTRRGTAGAIVAAAQSVLTGTRKVELVERDGSPWRFTVITYSSQSPDPSVIAAAIAGDKPVGLVATVKVLPGQTFGDVKASGMTFGQLKAQTCAQVREAVPE